MVWDGAAYSPRDEVIRVRGNLPLETADYLNLKDLANFLVCVIGPRK